MRTFMILAGVFALAACHETSPEQACAARFARLDNDNFRGFIPTYTFDLSAANPADAEVGRLQKMVKPGSSVALTVNKGAGPSMMQFQGSAVEKGSQAVARGCAMEGHGVKLVGLALSVANSANQNP